MKYEEQCMLPEAQTRAQVFQRTLSELQSWQGFLRSFSRLLMTGTPETLLPALRQT